MNRWRPTWISRCNELEYSVPLAHELSRNNLEVGTSIIPNEINGVFTKVPICANTVVGYYYGTFVYENLSISSSHGPFVYGEDPLAVPVKVFSRWTLQRQFNTICKHYFSIFPAPFCAIVWSTMYNILRRRLVAVQLKNKHIFHNCTTKTMWNTGIRA